MHFQQLQGTFLLVQRGFALRGLQLRTISGLENASTFFEPNFARRMETLSRFGGFMLYGKLGVDFSTSELTYPDMKVRLCLIRAQPNFFMISENPNVSVAIVGCPLNTRRIAFKDDYHKNRTDMLAYTPVEYNYLDTLAKNFIIAARQNQLTQEFIFNDAPDDRIAIALKRNSAFTGSFTENPFRYQQFQLRQIENSDKVGQSWTSIPLTIVA